MISGAEADRIFELVYKTTDTHPIELYDGSTVQNNDCGFALFIPANGSGRHLITKVNLERVEGCPDLRVAITSEYGTVVYDIEPLGFEKCRLTGSLVSPYDICESIKRRKQSIPESCFNCKCYGDNTADLSLLYL